MSDEHPRFETPSGTPGPRDESKSGYVWHWVRVGVMPYGWSTVRVWLERVGDKIVLDTCTDSDVTIAEWGPRIYEPAESKESP